MDKGKVVIGALVGAPKVSELIDEACDRALLDAGGRYSFATCLNTPLAFG